MNPSPNNGLTNFSNKGSKIVWVALPNNPPNTDLSAPPKSCSESNPLFCR